MCDLLAVPNLSGTKLEALASALGPARVLDVHADADHGRSVFTLAAPQGLLSQALLNLTRTGLCELDLSSHRGLHPHVGVVDVVPVVYLDEGQHGPAVAEALTAAGLIGEELGVPVFLYGELATADDRRERADLRRGGPAGLAARIDSGELVPDYGPPRVDQRSGATLVTARPPLIAFNVELESDDLELARRIAGGLREAGGGPRGVRAIGLLLPGRGRAQVSFNVHDYRAAPLAGLVKAVRAQAPVHEAEIVGLVPRAALDGFPDDVPLGRFDPARHVIENALGSD